MHRDWLLFLRARTASSVHYGPEAEILRIARNAEHTEGLTILDGPRPCTELESMTGSERARGRAA